MATLQKKSIVSSRKAMLEGGMKAVFKFLYSFKDIPDIQFEDHSHYELSVKDILAFTLVHSALCDNGQIFGGFLCSIYSGVVYNDVDIVFGEENQQRQFCNKICNIMENILGLNYEEYDIEEKRKTYGSCFVITATIEGITAKLEVDVACTRSIMSNHDTYVFHPVTWGRMLQYAKSGLSFRRLKSQQKFSKKPTLKYVEKLLSEQKDILCTHFLFYPRTQVEKATYDTYIQTKRKHLEDEGYNLE